MAALNTAALASRVEGLRQRDLSRLEQLLKDEQWAQALDLLDEIDREAKSISRSCTHLASKVNKQHWSPLLEAL